MKPEIQHKLSELQHLAASVSKHLEPVVLEVPTSYFQI